MKRLVIVVLLALFIIPVYAQDDTEEEMIESVTEALENFPGFHRVLRVELVEEKNQAILKVVYLTAETDQIGYQIEMIDMFRAVGGELERGAVDWIELQPSVSQNGVISVASASLRSVRRLTFGRISRSIFLEELITGPGSHLSSPGAEGNPA